MKQNLFPQEWLALSFYERQKFAETFSVKKSGGVVMQDNTILSDGYSMEDLMAINVESMRKFLESDETDFYKLYQSCIERFKIKEEEERKDKIVESRKINILSIQNAVLKLKEEARTLNIYDDIEWGDGEETVEKIEPEVISKVLIDKEIKNKRYEKGSKKS